jgi:UDP-N-acetylglucosamine 4,6-dehydratase/5-epimerase
MRKVFLTGVTGTLGTEVLKLLLAEPDTLVIAVSRDEQKQRLIAPHPRLSLVLADIRDRQALTNAAMHHTDYDVIYHLAALKCVDTLEANPLEAIKTNVLGTQNVVELARDLKAKVVMASTDKAVFPINAYGMSKALAEHIVLTASARHVVCRYGNVLGSRGSFLPEIVRQLNTPPHSVGVTDAAMTRFWLRAEDAARFVYGAGTTPLSEAGAARIKIPPMQSASVTDLIRATAKVMGRRELVFRPVGIRPGEKIHESITATRTSADSPMSQADLELLIAPLVERLCLAQKS